MEANVNPNKFKISELFEKKLEIPEFQRPYEWGKEHVEVLIEDLLEAEKENKQNYLIGNMVFFEENEKYKIIDGQQRIITLGLILYILEEEKENNFIELQIDNINSSKNIITNLEIIKNKFKNYSNKKKLSDFIKNNVIITALITNNLDQAFFLFDSQNTRGEPLERKDLLKVHHIRSVKSDEEKELLIKEYWEKYEKFKDEDKAFDLLEEILQFLSLTRKALRGEIEGDDLIEVDVYKEFSAEINKKEDNKLNNYNQPPLFEYFIYDIKNETIEFFSKKFSSTYPSCKILDGWRFLPFEIPQSIEAGEKFFYYLIKYINIYKEIRKKHSNIFSLFDGLWHAGNIYLNKVYKSLLIFYYDKFGKKGLEDFAYRLIIIFTYYGYKKEQIRKEGVINSFAKPNSEKINLYNLIFSKYYPELIKENLDKHIQFEIGDLEIEYDKNKFKIRNLENNSEEEKKEYSKNTRLGSFISIWYENDEIKEEIYKILNACSRNWEIKEENINGK